MLSNKMAFLWSSLSRSRLALLVAATVAAHSVVYAAADAAVFSFTLIFALDNFSGLKVTNDGRRQGGQKIN